MAEGGWINQAQIPSRETPADQCGVGRGAMSDDARASVDAIAAMQLAAQAKINAGRRSNEIGSAP